MDILASGPERPRGEGEVGRLLRLARRRLRDLGGPGAARWRRWAVPAVAVLATLGTLLALRAGTAAITPSVPAAAGDERNAPVIVYGPPRLQPPPFDRLPGRTPIPLPAPVGRDPEIVGGALPGTGAAPGEEAARRAVRLVLGRYCRFPNSYQIHVTDDHRWRRATAIVLRAVYIGPRKVATIRLSWTGEAYAWRGSDRELSGCS